MIKKIIIISFAFFTLISTSFSQGKVELKTKADSSAYAVGIQIGDNFRVDSLQFNLDILKAGIYDGLQGDTSKYLLTTIQMQTLLIDLQKELNARRQAERMKVVNENKSKGKAFLDKIKKEKNVKSTASGLLYKEVVKGMGEKPPKDGTVMVNYKGSLIDGTEFDKSPEGKPQQFKVDGLIKGWTEALQMMREGSKWILYIPSELAYGDQQMGPKIPAGSTLVFEVELVKVVK